MSDEVAWCPGCRAYEKETGCEVPGCPLNPPSPASPAVGGEEEARAWAEREGFLTGSYAQPTVVTAYLAGFSRGGEVEREKVKEERRAWHLQAEKDEAEFSSLRTTLEAVEKERDELRADNRSLGFEVIRLYDCWKNRTPGIIERLVNWLMAPRCNQCMKIRKLRDLRHDPIGYRCTECAALLASREEKKE